MCRDDREMDHLDRYEAEGIDADFIFNGKPSCLAMRLAGAGAPPTSSQAARIIADSCLGLTICSQQRPSASDPHTCRHWTSNTPQLAVADGQLVFRNLDPSAAARDNENGLRPNVAMAANAGVEGLTGVMEQNAC